MDALAVHELTGFRLDFHTFIVQKEVDESFASVGSRRFGSQSDVLAVAQHLVISDIIETGALLVVSQDKAHKGDSDGRLAGADTVRSGHDRLDKYGLCSREVSNKFFGARFSHYLVEARKPLDCQSVVYRMRHDEFATILGFDHVFQSLRR